MSLLELVNILLRRRRIIISVPLLTALVAGVTSFLMPAVYSATSSFVPEVAGSLRLPSGLSSIAGQVGLNLAGEPNQSPDFYSKVLQSRELLQRALLAGYPDPRSENPIDSTTLLRLLEVDGRDRADSIDNGLKALADLITVEVDRGTNIVTMTVDAPYPELAAQVTNRFVEYLNEFNTQTRQSQARERRKFIEQRLVEGERDLRNAEEGLRIFYERNRSWQQAPQLSFEEGRLRRQVQIRQELYLTLSREYETARIEEVNNTPVITVIDRAIPPPKRTWPKRAVLVALGFFLGGVIASFWAIGAEYFDRARQVEDADYREFTELRRRVRRELSRMVGRVRGKPSE